MAKEFYKLGPKASSFTDLAQKDVENQKLAPGQAKALDKTPTVSAFLSAGGLVIATPKDVEEYVKKKAETKVDKKTASSLQVQAAAQIKEAKKIVETTSKRVGTLEVQVLELTEESKTKTKQLDSVLKGLDAHGLTINENGEIVKKEEDSK